MYKSALALLFSFVLAFDATAASADWPTRPVRIVVPFAAGGNTDAVARLLATRLQDRLGQTFVVENRAGAGGVVATGYVAAAAPDGYTLLMSSTGAHVISPHLMDKLPYDPLKDLVPVSNVSSNAQVLLVNQKLPVQSVAELIALARKEPGKLNFGSAGPGGTTHLAGELFKSMAKVEMTHVPFRGGAPATLATVAGDVQLTFANLSDALPQMRSGKLRALAVTSAERQPQAPDVPTIAESGLPGYESIVWNGVVAPAGTPADIVAKLSSTIQEICREEAFRKSLFDIGSVPIGDTSAHFDQYVRQELERWGKVVKASGAKAM
ncbi:MAG: tripartite tricarboxylate transporter substrate binding protein [Pigmentiphaga sp.]|uniref:Bug family tripartite tricarboxylate transporter substrate binding protein n=1 Tax=Pigmentiphaga sp. TaxID=1977564 RepID=UPI0029BAD30A|nr:tripartite tricarboxylate transporter substrate binding protein [Pigmentiphaga sp.]MDX3904635.1 tripartite tricarboxylate transporter substrate binding protein [Pigmentiphaga sp.]